MLFDVLDEVCVPTRGTKYSAAVDLYASEDAELYNGMTAIIGLGVRIDIEGIKEKYAVRKTFGNMVTYNDDHYQNFMRNHYLKLEPRSSLRAKGFVAGTGIIDMDYPDEIKIILHKLYDPTKGGEVTKIKKGDRIAQIILTRHETDNLGVYTEDIRTGGIGSTNKE